MWIDFLNAARGSIDKSAIRSVYMGLSTAIREATKNNNARQLSELMKLQTLLNKYGDIKEY